MQVAPAAAAHRPRRLDKYLSEATDLSLAAVRAACRATRVALVRPGAPGPCPQPDDLVFAEDLVFLDGHLVRLGRLDRYAALHKPARVTSTAHDPDGHADLGSFLRQMPAGMFPVGRLDRDTTGLLLFTTDSDLQNAVLRPDQRTPKTYRLWLAGDREIDPRIARLTEGTLSAGRALRAQSARVVARSNGSTQVEVILTQGKNRQLRRMCHALKLRLHRLQRTFSGFKSRCTMPWA